ncbi:MAG: aldehyde dehydrogenase family protein [Actinomycetota bacterium]
MSTQSANPRTGQVFGPIFPDTSSQETFTILESALSAFNTWNRTPAAERGRALAAVADALDAHKEELASLADSETGLGLPRLTGEIARTTYQIRTFVDALGEGKFVTASLDPAVDAPPQQGHPKFLRSVRGIGVVAIFGANNFPFAFSVFGGDTASALAAGCSVVIKAHPSHPQTSQKIFDIAQAALIGAGAPAGLISLGHGLSFGRDVITDSLVSAGAFTGSHRGGRALFDLAQSRTNPIPFYGELGSINPVVLLASGYTDATTFATAYIDSLLLGSGQFCTNPSVTFIPNEPGLLAEIEKQLASRDPQPLLSDATKLQHDQNRESLKSALPFRVLHGKEASSTGFFSDPEVLVLPSNQISGEAIFETECFGPTGVVITYESVTDVIAQLEKLGGALAGSVFSAVDDPNAGEVIEALARVCGRVAWNAWPTGVSVTAGQQHGGPYPSATSPLHTSVGIHAMERFLRPVTFQGFPDELTSTY